jgi:soluble cytochrome b562
MSTLGKDATTIKGDPELSDLLKKLSLIKTARTFKRWKNSFLDRLESFLDQENIDNASKSYKTFSKRMETFVKLINNVNEHVEKGQLTVEQYTVKARMSLGEMSKDMTNIIDELERLIPQTSQLETKCGYNKFHIGAVLVRDGFTEYTRLDSCKDILQHMRTVSLNDVADKQILEEMDNYCVKLQKFCEIMADLGLYGTFIHCIYV